MLNSLLRLLALSPKLRAKEVLLRAYYSDIWALGEILFSHGQSNRERKRLLRELRQSWATRLSCAGDSPDPIATLFFSEARRLTDDQWEGLFHCYGNPRIPQTNNGTEQLIAQLKSLERLLARNPSPGSRFIRSAPITAAFVNRETLPGESFIASRSPEEIALVRRNRKAAAHKASVARQARHNLPQLIERLKARWKPPAHIPAPDGTRHNMPECEDTAS